MNQNYVNNDLDENRKANPEVRPGTVSGFGAARIGRDLLEQIDNALFPMELYLEDMGEDCWNAQKVLEALLEKAKDQIRQECESAAGDVDSQMRGQRLLGQHEARMEISQRMDGFFINQNPIKKGGCR
jgi:hypothetical protein